MILCPDCQKSHSDLAPACPTCGRPTPGAAPPSAAPAAAAAAATGAAPHGAASGRGPFGRAPLVVWGATLAAFGYCAVQNESRNASKTPEQRAREDAAARKQLYDMERKEADDKFWREANRAAQRERWEREARAARP